MSKACPRQYSYITALSTFVLDKYLAYTVFMSANPPINKADASGGNPSGTSSGEPRHPIQVVVRRTGLSADVIRVWERRYGVVCPVRAAGGRRIYSDDDVTRLSLLQKVTDAGRRISDVVNLDNAALIELINDDQQAQKNIAGLASAGLSGAAAIVENAFQAICDMNAQQLRKIISVAAAELPQGVFLDQVISPLLDKVGVFWHSGNIRVGQEHMASMVIRLFLVGQLGQGNPQARPIILTTPSDHQHDIGVLMAALIAESEGWRAICLGADIPASEIAAAALQSKSQAVALGIQYTADAHAMAEEVLQLRLALPEKIPLIVSGAAAIEHQELFAHSGILVPTDLSGFRDILTRIEH